MHMPITELCSEGEEIGLVKFEQEGIVRDIRCVRPYRIALSPPPKEVKDTSNSSLDWRTQIVPSGLGLVADIPSPSAWDGVLVEMRYYIHNQHEHI
jgi:hypothetical protein